MCIHDETFDSKQLGIKENKVILVSDYKDIRRFYLNQQDMEKYEITLQTMNKPHERELFVNTKDYLGVKKVNKDEYLTDNYVNLFEIVKNDQIRYKMCRNCK